MEVKAVLSVRSLSGLLLLGGEGAVFIKNKPVKQRQKAFFFSLSLAFQVKVLILPDNNKMESCN